MAPQSHGLRCGIRQFRTFFRQTFPSLHFFNSQENLRFLQKMCPIPSLRVLAIFPFSLIIVVSSFLALEEEKERGKEQRRLPQQEKEEEEEEAK